MVNEPEERKESRARSIVAEVSAYDLPTCREKLLNAEASVVDINAQLRKYRAAKQLNNGQGADPEWEARAENAKSLYEFEIHCIRERLNDITPKEAI